jgi:osmotically-inducible protein OsmY
MGRSMRRNMDYEQNQDYEPMSYTYMEFWMVPGPETGRGPRDYRRSDERIIEDIVERLMLHGYINASDVTVSVANGEVTLSGNVRSRREKRMAEDVVDSVTGVQDVHNELKVKPEHQMSSDFGKNQG